MMCRSTFLVFAYAMMLLFPQRSNAESGMLVRWLKPTPRAHKLDKQLVRIVQANLRTRKAVLEGDIKRLEKSMLGIRLDPRWMKPSVRRKQIKNIKHKIKARQEQLAESNAALSNIDVGLSHRWANWAFDVAILPHAVATAGNGDPVGIAVGATFAALVGASHKTSVAFRDDVITYGLASAIKAGAAVPTQLREAVKNRLRDWKAVAEKRAASANDSVKDLADMLEGL